MSEPRSEADGWTPLELYVWTLENLGVPSKVTLLPNGQFSLEGPFKKLTLTATKRLVEEARRAAA